MTSVEITTSWEDLGLAMMSAAAMLAGIILYTRIVGLRTFSKMSSFDFAVTVAMGSLLAAVAMSDSSLLEGLAAAATLLAAQALIALGRLRAGLSRFIDNEPLLLMVGPDMITENLRRARVTSDDIRAKLRAANVLSYEDVRYVVLETTGDISVVHGSGDIDHDILRDLIDQPTSPRADRRVDSIGGATEETVRRDTGG